MQNFKFLGVKGLENRGGVVSPPSLGMGRGYKTAWHGKGYNFLNASITGH